MDILTENSQKAHNRTVQKLHLRQVMEYILDCDIDKQSQLITLLSIDMKLTPISKAKTILNKSYNGVKQFGNTIKLGGKIFVILK